MLDQISVCSLGGQILFNKTGNGEKQAQESPAATLKPALVLINHAISAILHSHPSPITLNTRKIHYKTTQHAVFLATHSSLLTVDWVGVFLADLASLYTPAFDQNVLNTLLLEHNVKSQPRKQRTYQQSKKYRNTLATTEVAKPKDKLDYSTHKAGATVSSQSLVGNSLGLVKDGVYNPLELEIRTLPATSTSKATALSFFAKLMQGAPLDSKSLTPVLTKMKEHLVAKNVAHAAALFICQHVKDEIIGTTIGPLDSVTAVVKKHVCESVTRILMPDSCSDILMDVLKGKRENRVFSIVFCGVNGVGKSTNLAKLTFWLLQNKVSVLIAACDTFRSGAVEQLKVHVQNLNQLAGSRIELFDQGYGKDPAGICAAALEYAQGKFNVVLVDTAGRMQDNTLLMRALTKLINTNSPDKIVFVGEALVGNEAVSQLTKFNAAIIESSNRSRQIDGIILSKFDTVDDKVGAAVSMSFITKKPIIFVGTGQTYTDLRRMNIPALVDLLLN